MAKKHAEDLAPHVFGEKPEKILKVARPNEPPEMLQYRLDVWEPITQTEYTKIENVLLRIFTPGNFAIKHKPNPAGVLADFETFTEKEFHQFGSVMNFLTDAAFRNDLGDPNAVILYRDSIPEEGKYSNPYPTIYSSVRVLDIRPGEVVSILVPEKSWVMQGQTSVEEGNILLFSTPTSLIRASQTGKKEDNIYQIEILETHNLGFIPARWLGGQLTVKDGILWNTSFIAGVIPHWNKAIQLTSDFDGYKALHLFPKYAQISIPCSTCQGSGTVVIDAREGERGKCGACGGSKIQGGGAGPFSMLTLNPEDVGKYSVNDLAAFISPGGNVMAETRTEIDHCIVRGFAAMNMEVVGQTQSNTSADKVALDRQDLNGTLADVAGHFFDLLEWNYRVIGALRYGTLVPLASQKEKLLPEITRPVHFDYVTLDGMLAEIERAQVAKMPPSIMSRLYMKAAAVTFGDGNENTKRIHAEIELDPYQGMGADDILAMNSILTSPIQDLFIHFNIHRLIEAAISDDPKFLDLAREKQLEILKALAKKMLPDKEEPPEPAPEFDPAGNPMPVPGMPPAKMPVE